jgi:putative transposase
MGESRYGGHTVTRLTVHIVWVTKYRYEVYVVRPFGTP